MSKYLYITILFFISINLADAAFGGNSGSGDAGTDQSTGRYDGTSESLGGSGWGNSRTGDGAMGEASAGTAERRDSDSAGADRDSDTIPQGSTYSSTFPLSISTSTIYVGQSALLSWDGSPLVARCQGTGNIERVTFGNVTDVFQCNGLPCTSESATALALFNNLPTNNGSIRMGSTLAPGTYNFRAGRPRASYSCYDDGTYSVPPTYSNIVTLRVLPTPVISALDLAVDVPGRTGALSVGTELTFTAQIDNLGNTNSGAFRSRIFIQHQDPATTTWTTVSNVPQAENNLTVGSTRPLTLAWTPTATGTYRARADLLDPTTASFFADSDMSNNASEWITFEVKGAPPTVKLYTRHYDVAATPMAWTAWVEGNQTIAYNEQVQMWWDIADADWCYFQVISSTSSVSNIESPANGSAGRNIVEPAPNDSADYRVRCGNEAGVTMVQWQVEVGPVPTPPVVDMWFRYKEAGTSTFKQLPHPYSTASGTTPTTELYTIASTTAIELKWRPRNATDCKTWAKLSSSTVYIEDAYGFESGTSTLRAFEYDDAVTPAPGNTIDYRVTCTNNESNVTALRHIAVYTTSGTDGITNNPNPNKNISLAATPKLVRKGETVRVTWDLDGNSSCNLKGPINVPGTNSDASDGDGAVVTTDGSNVPSHQLQQEATFMLNCGGSVSENVTVGVLPTVFEN